MQWCSGAMSDILGAICRLVMINWLMAGGDAQIHIDR